MHVRKTLVLALSAALVLVLVGVALAAAIQVKVNGKTVSCSVAPYSRHDTKFVQITPVCKAVGAEVTYDGAAKRVTICRNGTCTSLTVGDGAKDAYIKNDSATCAYKVLAEKLHGSASYDADAGVISFTIN